MKLRTYKDARKRIIDILKSDDAWTVKDNLKTPWAKHEDMTVKIWFKPQAIWFGDDRPYHSMHLDIRILANYPDKEIREGLIWKLIKQFHQS